MKFFTIVVVSIAVVTVIGDTTPDAVQIIEPPTTPIDNAPASATDTINTSDDESTPDAGQVNESPTLHETPVNNPPVSGNNAINTSDDGSWESNPTEEAVLQGLLDECDCTGWYYLCNLGCSASCGRDPGVGKCARCQKKCYKEAVECGCKCFNRC